MDLNIIYPKPYSIYLRQTGSGFAEFRDLGFGVRSCLLEVIAQLQRCFADLWDLELAIPKQLRSISVLQVGCGAVAKFGAAGGHRIYGIKKGFILLKDSDVTSRAEGVSRCQ